MINIQHSLGKALGFTLRMYTKNLQVLFDQEKLPLSVDQFVMLSIIHHHRDNKLTQIELSSYVGKDKSAVLRHLDYMAGLKLLGRVEDINDRRKKILHLTKKGEELLAKAQILEQKLSKTVLHDMSKTEIDDFMKNIDHILMNIMKLENS